MKTLIALVVTIVIILILAAITITMTLGENGLSQRSQDAKNAKVIWNSNGYTN
jgi:FlaG/FlaF family flagellin (archaellin)